MMAFISAGAIQLLVGPASFSSTEQMKVRSSTRATSLGSEAQWKRVGLLVRVEPGEGAGGDQLVGQPVPLLVGAGRPSGSRSGVVSAATSSTQAARPG